MSEPIEKTAPRNMFYDEYGKHVRTKKEILDENGNIRKGCKIVKKGEVYKRTLFTNKNKLFKQEDFVDEVKHFYTDLINLLVNNDKEKLRVFDSNGLYLATKKIGKNNPKSKQIQTDNEYRMYWNREVDRAIVSGVAETPIKPEILSKPVMPAEAAAYPKLSKIYKELKRQNEIIFEAEKERNALELEHDDLKGIARFTKKGELQSKIDRKNEEIEILKIGLSGIVKRYGYQNVQEFYRIYHKFHSAYADYQEKTSK